MRYWEAEGLTTIAACQVLHTLAANVPVNQWIVEVGVFKGRSLLALAEGSLSGNGAHVAGLDPWDLPRPSKPKYSDPAVREYAISAVGDSPAGHLIVLVQGFSVEEAKRWKGGPIGLLYIDSDHRKGPVLQDVAAWAPHLAPGAVVAFDDHNWATFPGVVQAVTQLIEEEKLCDMFMATDRLAVATWVG